MSLRRLQNVFSLRASLLSRPYCFHQGLTGPQEDGHVYAESDILKSLVNPAFSGFWVVGEDAYRFVSAADSIDGRPHQVSDAGVLDLSGDAEGLGEVVGAEENYVNVGDGDDFCEVLNAALAFDVNDDEGFLVEWVGDVGAGGRVGGGAGAEGKASCAEGVIFGAANNGLSLGFGFDAGNLDAGATNVEGSLNLGAVVFADADEGGKSGAVGGAA